MIRMPRHLWMTRSVFVCVCVKIQQQNGHTTTVHFKSSLIVKKKSHNTNTPVEYFLKNLIRVSNSSVRVGPLEWDDFGQVTVIFPPPPHLVLGVPSARESFLPFKPPTWETVALLLLHLPEPSPRVVFPSSSSISKKTASSLPNNRKISFFFNWERGCHLLLKMSGLKQVPITLFGFF